MKSVLIAPFVALFAGAAQVPDVSEFVTATLETDRAVYHVGEAVKLKLTIRNHGQIPVFGHFLLMPYLPDWGKTAALEYCLAGHPCSEFLDSMPGIEEMSLHIPRVELLPGRETWSPFIMAFNPRDKRLVLESPGEYEIRWTSRGIHARAGLPRKARGPEIKASVNIRVLPVPAAETQAFNAYVAGRLAAVAQCHASYGPGYQWLTPEVRRAAVEFLERYPDSLYAPAVRAPLIEFLRVRVRGGYALPEEPELWRRIDPSAPR